MFGPLPDRSPVFSNMLYFGHHSSSFENRLCKVVYFFKPNVYRTGFLSIRTLSMVFLQAILMLPSMKAIIAVPRRDLRGNRRC